MKKILICTLAIIILVVVLKVANVKRIILRKMYVKDYSEYVYEYATEYNVDPLLVFAVIKAESNFKKDATSTSNAIGLMQLMENTAIETGEKVNEKINSNNTCKQVTLSPKNPILQAIKMVSISDLNYIYNFY
mgnify:CR=1 FL=1